MTRICLIAVLAVLPVPGQRIETQKTDRTYITRLGTVQNHLSVIELNEPVVQVAAGSSSFKIEWRENKVFVQPLEPEAATNLFIWTASGRLNYELIPAASVEQMHFAIDQPAPELPKETPAPPGPQPEPAVPSSMLMESAPIRVLGAGSSASKVQIILQDVYRKGGRVYLRYAIVNGSRTVYLPGPPEVFTLSSPRAPQSLIPLANSQLAENFDLKWKGEIPLPVRHNELQASIVAPGQAAHGVTAFELPAPVPAGNRTVVRLVFPADAKGLVTVLLVL